MFNLAKRDFVVSGELCLFLYHPNKMLFTLNPQTPRYHTLCCDDDDDDHRHHDQGKLTKPYVTLNISTVVEDLNLIVVSLQYVPLSLVVPRAIRINNAE